MTILFKGDWVNKHPGAIIHDTTKNKSFIHIVKVYESMGVSNCAFPLALHNPDLKDIDPFDPDLGRREIEMITDEVADNFWYYIREVVRIPNEGGIEGIPFRANRGSLTTYWLFHNHITTIVVQPRQTGKTVSMSSLMRGLLNIYTVKTPINFLTLDDVLRQETVDTIRGLEYELPYYFKLTGPEDSEKNPKTITVHALGNILRGFLPQRSKKAARNVMRGQTTAIFWIDEAASLYNIDISLPVLLMAGNDARQKAEQRGTPYGTILTTNAGDKADASARYIYGLLQDSTVWSETFLDCKDLNDLKKVIAGANSAKEVRINATFSHRQLGYTDEWLIKNLKAAMADGRDAEKDLLNRWKDGSAESPLSQEDIKSINDSLVTDPRTEIDTHGYVVRYYVGKEEFDEICNNRGAVIATDTSDAVGRDDISFVVRDIRDGGVIAASTINEVNLLGFANWLADWLIKYTKTILIPERRSSGVTIIDIIIEVLLSKRIDPFNRIFNWVIHDIENYPDVADELRKPVSIRSSSIYLKYRKQFGYGTSASGKASRNNLYGVVLTQAVKYTSHLVRDAIIIQQLSSLMVRNGRIDHPDGEHDDMVIGWLLSYWLMVYGKNLNYYNISSAEILSRNTRINSKEERSQKQQVEYINRLKEEVLRLSKQIVDSKDPVSIMVSENKLRTILENNKLLSETIGSFSELKNRIEMEKRKRK